MTVAEIVSALGLEVLTGGNALGKIVTGGYSSDLLSCAMAGARGGDVWVTLQAHQNVVAVATLTDVACVIVTEGARPDAATSKRAEGEGVVLLATKQDTFATIVRLVELGVERASS
ncbi:MAG: DRTGG domain-containing protein [Anaerolineae bacterium]